MVALRIVPGLEQREAERPWCAEGSAEALVVQPRQAQHGWSTKVGQSIAYAMLARLSSTMNSGKAP